MDRENTTDTRLPSENLLKAMIGYENLSEEDKRLFEAELDKAKPGNISERLKTVFNSTRSRILNALKRSRLTKVRLEKSIPERLIDNDIDPATPLLLTIANGEEVEDEIRTQIEELTAKISKEFSVDRFAFIEIFHDYYELLHYYIFTNEPIDFNNYFNEGYELHGYNDVDNSYSSYILRNNSQKEIKDIQKKLVNIFSEQFPHRERQRIIKFISKSNFVESIIGFQQAIQEHKRKFN